MSGGISVSKLKSELRQAQRLLSRNDKLNASLRVETERRVESLKSQIAEEQQRRGAEEAVQPTPERVKAANDQDGNAAAGFGAGGAESALEASKPAPKKKKTAKEEKYKMLRHVEFKKSSRRLKQAERDLASVVSQIQSIPEDDSKTNRKARKTLEKEKSQAEIKREHARIDAWYGSTFPPQYKYVALYPAGKYVEFGDLPTPAQSATTPEEKLELYVQGMPPARKPDDVRSYWRAVVKARLDSGDLVGNPQSSSGTSKVTKIKDGKKGAIGVVQPMSKQEAASEDEEVDDVDDFFE